MSDLSLAPVFSKRAAWLDSVGNLARRILLGPDPDIAEEPLPDTGELAQSGKISDWLRLD